MTHEKEARQEIDRLSWSLATIDINEEWLTTKKYLSIDLESLSGITGPLNLQRFLHTARNHYKP